MSKIYYDKFQASSQVELDQALISACLNDNIDEIKYLLTSKDIKLNANIHADEDFLLRTACRSGNLELIKYYLTSPELKEHANIHAKSNNVFNFACYSNQLDILRYILTSPELKEHANLDIAGFANACGEGHLDLVKYLLTSSELSQHIDLYAEDNRGFRWAVNNNQIEIARYFIFDLKMEKNESIDEFLKENPNEDVEKMFQLASLNKNLDQELNSNNSLSKRLKI